MRVDLPKPGSARSRQDHVGDPTRRQPMVRRADPKEHERAGARALPVQLGIAAAGGGTAYLSRSRPVPTYSLVSSRVNLACASMTVEIHSTSLCLATCSW
jgi:hypothetical protein